MRGRNAERRIAAEEKPRRALFVPKVFQSQSTVGLVFTVIKLSRQAVRLIVSQAHVADNTLRMPWTGNPLLNFELALHRPRQTRCIRPHGKAAPLRQNEGRALGWAVSTLQWTEGDLDQCDPSPYG